MFREAQFSSDLRKLSSEPVPAASSDFAGTLTEYSSGKSVPCDLLAVTGLTITVQASLQVPLQASVKVEHSNRMWTGEVWACTAATVGFTIEIQSTLMLNDVAAVERLADRFMHRRRDRPAPVSTRAVLPRSE